MDLSVGPRFFKGKVVKRIETIKIVYDLRGRTANFVNEKEIIEAQVSRSKLSRR